MPAIFNASSFASIESISFSAASIGLVVALGAGIVFHRHRRYRKLTTAEVLAAAQPQEMRMAEHEVDGAPLQDYVGASSLGADVSPSASPSGPRVPTPSPQRKISAEGHHGVQSVLENFLFGLDATY